MPNIERHDPGSFCWFELATTDQTAAKKFYTSLFGWSVSDFPMGPGSRYSIFQVEGQDAAAAFTIQPEHRGMPPNWTLYVAVENADYAVQQAVSAGGKAVVPTFDVTDAGRMAVLADPTGAVFAVWQPKKSKGTGIAGVDGTVCWADLSTPDVEIAGKFYGDLFGWQISADNDSSGYSHIKNGDRFIGGIQSAATRNSQAPPHWMIYFLVSDCNAAAAKAAELGSQPLMAPMDIPKVGRMAILKDPQGAVFALFQPEAK